MIGFAYELGDNMELQKLKYFQVVAKYQHITKASEELNISQPSLTQAMHLLETELDVALFKKQGRGIILTECGKLLKDRLDKILPAIENLPNELLKLSNNEKKTIKLNILAASSFIINSIVEYRNKNPEVVFDFEQNELRHDCDISITTNSLKTNKEDESIKTFVKSENIYLAVPKSSPLANKEKINLIDVKEENFIMLTSARLFGALCNKFCSMAGFLPKILFESDSPSAVQNIIGINAGVAFWPEYSWGKMKNKNIVLIKVVNPVCKRDLIIKLHDRLPKSTYAEDFYNFLIKKLDN